MHIKQTLNRLGRSSTDQVLGGVCAGFAEVTDTPAWLWRVAFMLVALGFGTGVLLYFILWALMPLRNESA